MRQRTPAWLALVCFAAHIATAAASPASESVRATARDIFQTLIAFRTAEGLGQVPVMAKYLAQRLRDGGFPASDIHVLPLADTASLVVRYRGDGTGGKPILLLAHMDVVTANRDEWTRDPYTLIEEGGYFFGRGTADIKNEIAVLVTTFLRLRAEGFVPTRDLILVLTGDEETTQATTLDLVTRHRALIDAEFALNGDGGGGVLAEETNRAQVYYLQGSEKGYASYEITVRNPGGHSSAPPLDNAIYDLASTIRGLQAYRFPVMWNEWTLGSFKAASAATPGKLGETMARFAANPRDAEAADALFAEPQYVGRTRTTCVPTLLKAGHADNALPQTATVTVNCRIFPGMSAEVVQASLAQAAGKKATIRMIHEPVLSEPSPHRKDVLDAVTKAVHASYPGAPVVPDMAPYTTDGSVLRRAGIPTYGVAGMFIKDSDNFSHGLNERMPVAPFYKSLDHWYVLIKELAGRR